MEHKHPDVYRSGVRRYKPRASRDVPKQETHFEAIQASSDYRSCAGQIGPRLYENMMIIARRCANERTGKG